MKATLKTKEPQRKLVMVLAENGCGFFVRSGVTWSTFIGKDGSIAASGLSLEERLMIPGRTPVYEGDTVEITL